MVVHGISMGGATTMMVSGEDLPEYVGAFVDDCGYTSAWDQFSHNMKQQFAWLPASSAWRRPKPSGLTSSVSSNPANGGMIDHGKQANAHPLNAAAPSADASCLVFLLELHPAFHDPFALRGYPLQSAGFTGRPAFIRHGGIAYNLRPGSYPEQKKSRLTALFFRP